MSRMTETACELMKKQLRKIMPCTNDLSVALRRMTGQGG